MFLKNKESLPRFIPARFISLSEIETQQRIFISIHLYTLGID